MLKKNWENLNIADFEKQFRKLCFDVFSVNKSDAKADCMKVFQQMKRICLIILWEQAHMEIWIIW